MRKGYVPEALGRLSVQDKGWQRYTHLEGEKREAFQRLYKSPRRAFLFAFFFGGLGVHRFYLRHMRIGLAILVLWLVVLLSGFEALWWAAAVIYLIELGHIVRTTEQLNDSVEGALMLETYSKPLFHERDIA